MSSQDEDRPQDDRRETVATEGRFGAVDGGEGLLEGEWSPVKLFLFLFCPFQGFVEALANGTPRLCIAELIDEAG